MKIPVSASSVWYMSGTRAGRPARTASSSLPQASHERASKRTMPLKSLGDPVVR